MKKLIAAVVLSLSFCFSAVAGPTFGHWVVNDEATVMWNQYEDTDGSTVSLGVHRNGTPAIITRPSGWVKNGDSAITQKRNIVIMVNGVNVMFTVNDYSDGSTLATPKNDAGVTHFGNELWSKSRVVFVFQDGSTGWFSAKGVQKGWKYMQNNYAI